MNEQPQPPKKSFIKKLFNWLLGILAGIIAAFAVAVLLEFDFDKMVKKKYNEWKLRSQLTEQVCDNFAKEMVKMHDKAKKALEENPQCMGYEGFYKAHLEGDYDTFYMWCRNDATSIKQIKKRKKKYKASYNIFWLQCR